MKKNLPVRQRDRTDCGAACIASVCAYYNHFVPVARVRQYAGTDKYGTSIHGIRKAAARLGFDTVAARAGFGSLGSIQLPAIVQLRQENNADHFVVLAALHKTQVTLMDPAEGKCLKTGQEVFKQMWTGIVVIFTINDDFMPLRRRSQLGRFASLIAPVGQSLLLALGSAVIISLLGLTSSLYVRKIIDQVLTKNDMQLLYIISLMMIIFLVIQTGMDMVKSFLELRTSRWVDATLVSGYYRHLLQLPQRFLDSMQVGEMTSRINDAVRISIFINQTAINIIINLLMLGFAILFMFFYYWKLALIMLLIMPLFGAVFYISDRMHSSWQRRLMESGAAMESQMVETLSVAGTIKKLALEEVIYNKTNKLIQDLLGKVYRSSAYQAMMHHIADLVTRLFTVIILWSGSHYVLQQHLTTGELLSFYALMAYFTMPVLQLLSAHKNIRESFIAADRLFEIMDLEPEHSGNARLNDRISEIVFRDVFFQYGSGKDLLKTVNFSLRSGTTTGISGVTGSGKSTVAALLQKLYVPDQGEITVNGTGLNELDNSFIRNKIVSVPQHTELFSGTILENITIGCKAPDMLLVDRICGDLGITGFIDQMQRGLATFIRGPANELSGGQQQQISIARALYRQPEVLILDEATSAMDPEAEGNVLHVIRQYAQKGTIVLVIAHSPSVLQCCDRVLVVENGVIIHPA